MADRLTIARPYAKAAFAQAHADNRLASWSEALSAAAIAVVDARVKPLLGSPKLTAPQLAQLILDVAGRGLDDNGRRFVGLLAENKRLGFLPEISRVFDVLKDEAEGTVDVNVTSAAPIGAAEQATLAASLEARFGRRVRVHAAVDPSLIGGALVQAGDLVIDGTLKSRLERLAFELNA